MINLLKQEERFKMIQDLKKPFNIDRKSQSLYRSDIQKDKIKPFVLDELKKQLMESTVAEMPVVSTINIQKRVVSKKACVYKEEVERTFEGLSDDQIEKVNAVYSDGQANIEFNKCNKKLIYENQTIMSIIPRRGKIEFKKLELHQVDVFNSSIEPEKAEVFVFSIFDKEQLTQTDAQIQNSATGLVPTKDKYQGDKPAEDSDIANKEDYKKSLEKYLVWNAKYNFLMDGHGQILDIDTEEVVKDAKEQDILNPLASLGLIPYVDISREKDGAFWNDQGASLSDFTVQFNTMISDLANNMKLNGYAVAILKAGSDFKPEGITVGASMLIHLPTDDNEQAPVDFEFASPSSNIGEISEGIDKILNYFITTEDLDSSAINSTGSSQKFASGWDRFLALTEKREATKEDYAIFKNAEENEAWPIVRGWLNVLTGTETLNKKYHTGVISDEIEAKVDYKQSKALLTESEKITNIKGRNELGLESRVTMLMKLDGITEQEAIEEITIVDRTKVNELPIIEDNNGEES